MLQARVVDEHVDRGRQGVHRVEVGKITGVRLDPLRRVRQLVEADGVEIDRHHLRAVARQTTGDRRPDPAGRAGDEGAPTVQPAVLHGAARYAAVVGVAAGSDVIHRRKRSAPGWPRVLASALVVGVALVSQQQVSVLGENRRQPRPSRFRRRTV